MSDRDAGGDRGSDTMGDRVAGSRLRTWLLLRGDRRLVAGSLLVGVFLAVVVAGLVHPRPAHAVLVEEDPVETLFQALVTSTVTGVTLVLTISQLVLSQELGALGDQRERMQGAVDFRRDAAAAVDAAVAPAEPSAFLRALVESSRHRAEAFGEAVGADDPDFGNTDEGAVVIAEDADLVDVAAVYVSNVVQQADAVAGRLDGAQFGEFEVVAAALDFEYSPKIYTGKRIRERFADDLSGAAADRLDDLLGVLELFGPAREHFKTLYFQWELSDLSRTLLYAAIPALAVAVVSLVFFSPADFPGSTLGVSHSLVLLALATTVSLAPFGLLLAYVFRIVTVTKRTLSIGPFLLRETARSGEIEWE